MPLEDRTLTTEYVVEVRYKALGRIVDIRGLIADHISQNLDLSFWSITENRVDFKLEEDTDREVAFVSHRNFGYVVRQCETRHYFPDRALRFVRELTRINGFELRPVLRFGVRCRVVLPFEGKFGDLLKRVNELIPVDRNYVQPFNAQVEDVGPVYILRRGDTRIRFQAGPMNLDQAKTFLPFNQNLPDVGFYIDLDQYQSNVDKMEERDIAGLLKLFNNQSWEAIDFYNRLLF